ncbi:MAG: hypothetical protein JRH07_02570 [Deltaproteobacteria bacterium]|nr:hypothetical protein [Deltaproteobacteria bacterium]MBW2120715.1 hypothetical protein [Deltaproteobacteria bacterium]
MMRRLVIVLFMVSTVLLAPARRGQTLNSRGWPASRTPYDRKYRKVETYLASTPRIDGRFSCPSFVIQRSRIEHYLEEARRFRFQEEGTLATGKQQDHWQLPEETEKLRSGDCEDLAIWLYCRLIAEGFSNIRFTLGLAGATKRAMHAWVTWYEKGKTYILDPSRKQGIYSLDLTEATTYQPYYSYYLDRKWHHQ